jgi:hypothetical protein
MLSDYGLTRRFRTRVCRDAYCMVYWVSWLRSPWLSVPCKTDIYRSIIGPAIGGLLAQPCTNYHFCSQTSLLGRYPFLLPNLFSAACVCLGVLIGILFLEETHPIKKYEKDRGLELGRQIVSFLPGVRRQRCYEDTAEKHPLLSAGDSLPAYTEHCRQHSSTDASDCCEAVILDDVPLRTPLKLEASFGASTPTFNRNVVLNIISYGILAL